MQKQKASKDMSQENKNKHKPVLLAEILGLLDPKPHEAYADMTAGYGGHANAVLARTEDGVAVLVDRDDVAVESLHTTFTRSNVIIRHQDFLSASQAMLEQGQQFDLLLADLGVSSPHLNISSRGFAISLEGPLDMRMDQRQSFTAADIVNGYEVDELAQLIWRYGEEPRSRQIARMIVQQRPFSTTSELAAAISKEIPRRGTSAKLHPATRTFQALRIAVNDELGLLEKALPLWLELLKPGGRLAVVSFHSLEDRIVKRFLAQTGAKKAYDAVLTVLTPKPITPSAKEVAINPRARSAKLRAAVKNKNGREGHANTGKKHLPRL